MDIDTSIEIRRRMVERWTAMTVTERAELTEALCIDTTRLAIAGINLENPDLTQDERLYELAVRRYGRTFAEEMHRPTTS